MFSCTDQRGGNITKSAAATPGFVVGHVSTVNIDGSYKTIRQISQLNARFKGLLVAVIDFNFEVVFHFDLHTQESITTDEPQSKERK